ncbi:lysine--tRNA ligase [Candidatus Gracilibacteria bacterium]|nr:lysine--tRNA ligase [Candidatus Gracilibacteria bacterium]MCF7856654.1 lysine--tRNA ligase [Candidatus Gracilibacteria bacterium]MCF7896971.1 lysine--tRNA ligase [Candidatus Gracilibacteria bacterium]
MNSENPNREETNRSNRAKQLREKGINPYANASAKTHTLAQAGKLKDGEKKVKVRGRITLLRGMGKLAFLRLTSMEGEYQIVLQNETTKDFKLWLDHLDLGDFVEAEGETFTTKHGEASLLIKKLTLLTKALSPLPEKFHGLVDVEKKYRERHLDLATNLKTRERFLFRSNLVKALRNFFDAEGFIEVETPILQAKPSGAVATPFRTHHAALDFECVLRIAPETYLKRCLIGGFEKVFEMARCFRNEGIDPTHLQDFTMMELYASYENYEYLIKLAEKMFDTITKLLGEKEIEFGGKKISLKTPFKKIDLVEAIEKETGLNLETATDAEIRAKIKELKIEVTNLPKLGRGNLIDTLYKKVLREKIVNPTFIINHPVELSPLSRRSDSNNKRVDRFQLVINGWEVINAFSELTDSEDQAERFATQQKAREDGDTEAMENDDDFVKALSHGMPPAAGWGIGIDRLVALLTNSENLKDVVLFPLMKPEK